MGEHQTWFDFLDHIEGWRNFSGSVQGSLGRNWKLLMFDQTHWTLTHVLFAMVVLAVVSFGALRFHAGVKDGGLASVVPPAKLNVRNIFEMMCDVIMSLAVGVMGEKNARKHFPFIGSLALFILFSNVMALIPGFGVPTTTLKTNLALAGLVFLYYNAAGLKEHGLRNYLKQFTGSIKPLMPLMLLIEIVSHVVRPLSLALRLMGNMAGDHKVVFSFFVLVPWLVPLPFLFLGIMVSVIQTIVFCLLSMVYISMAVAHDH